MTVGGAFRRLTRTLRRIEQAGWTVKDVEPADGSGLRQDDILRVTAHCYPTEGLSTAPTELSRLVAGAISSSVEAVVHEGDDSSGTRVLIEVPLQKKQHTEGSEADEDLPLHLDVARLEELYADHATFEAMAAAVEEDVSDETIRRYTIEHDIHQPNKRTTVRAEQHASPMTPNRHAIPEPIDTDQVIDAVTRSRSLHEVQQRLGMERDTTVATLRRLNLLDLVAGSGNTPLDDKVRRETINRRVESVGPDSTRVTASGRNG